MARKDISDELICRACLTRERGAPILPGEILMNWTGQHWKVVLRALERADDRGFVDCGVSLWSAFLTEKGRKLIDAPPLRAITEIDLREWHRSLVTIFDESNSRDA